VRQHGRRTRTRLPLTWSDEDLVLVPTVAYLHKNENEWHCQYHPLQPQRVSPRGWCPGTVSLWDHTENKSWKLKKKIWVIDILVRAKAIPKHKGFPRFRFLTRTQWTFGSFDYPGRFLWIGYGYFVRPKLQNTK